MIRDWLRLASTKRVVVRGLKYSVVVGSILLFINPGNALVDGTVDATRLIQMMLTLLVPYCVSTASSFGAIIDHRDGVMKP